MPNTFHDQLTGSDLHENKIDATTTTELTPASQAKYDLRWSPKVHAHPDTDLSSLTTLNARYAYKTIRTIAPNTMNGDYLTDGSGDEVEVNQAIIAVSNSGGGAVVVLNRPTGSYSVNASIETRDNVDVISNGAVFTSSMDGSNGRGIFNVTGRSNVELLGLNFNLPGGGCWAITSYGHDGLRIRRCQVTGAATQDSVILLNGGNGVADFLNTFFEGNRFTNLPNIDRCIRLYPRNGHIVEGVYAQKNLFKSTRGPCFSLDSYDVLRDVHVTHNRAIDTINGNTVNTPGVMLATRISSGGAYYITDLEFDDNYYRNTLTTNLGQGCIFFYETKNVKVRGNTMIGAWTNGAACQGPAIAPGRTSYPAISAEISDNYIEGFNSPWDPDSMRIMDCHDNTVVNCGGTFALGYSTQDYVQIHHNTHYNCFGDTSSPYTAFIALANSSNAKKCRIYDNTYIDDTASPRPIWFIELTGNYNFGDVEITGNKAYIPNGTITEYVHRELGSETYPRLIESNEVHDATGVTREFRLVLGNKTGAFTVNPAAGAIQSATLTGSITPTINTGTYKGQKIDLELTQDATDGHTCAKPVNSKVPGGTLPISTAANARDVYRFRWSGVSWDWVGYQLNLS